ncbi:MAG TPA: ATP-binding protein [Phenylobacterium sp.]|jgi:nitrogen fixation/metabolism regulation signal transduction histidine kinase
MPIARSRLLRLLLAQAAVGGGAVLCGVAWRAGLPANALLAGVVALAGAAWSVAHLYAPADEAPELTEADVERLDQERERRTLQAFLDQAPTPLVLLRPDGALAAVNRAARRLFRTDTAVADPAGALHAAVEAATPAERGKVRLELDGQARTFVVTVAEVVGAGGVLKLAALTDIQAELQAAEAAALKELLRVLSHEIMNSLTPLASLAQSAEELLGEGTPQSLAQARNAVGIVSRRTEGLHRFVEAYRELARLPDPVQRLTSVAGLLREAASLFEARWAAQGVTLELALPEPDVMARLDTALTGQALSNLLTNAAEAALAGARTPPRVSLAGRAAGGGVSIVVEDSGEGIAPDRTADVFRPFFTTKQGGSGIGLSLAQQAIASQGGDLTLAPPAPGRGARFTIAL